MSSPRRLVSIVFIVPAGRLALLFLAGEPATDRPTPLRNAAPDQLREPLRRQSTPLFFAEI
jgi:hypothetical protein